MPAGTEGRGLDDFFASGGASFTPSLWPASNLEPTDRSVNGGSMDLVVVAIIAALAALSFLWLRLVEQA